MKKILLTSAAIFLLQTAVTAHADFDNTDFEGTFGYSLTGSPRCLDNNGNVSLLYMSEVGVFKADGDGNISDWTASASIVGATSTNQPGFCNIESSNEEVVYTGCTYSVDFNGRGTIMCADRNSIFLPPVPDVRFPFVIDDNNQEIRLETVPYTIEPDTISFVILNGSAYKQLHH